MMKYCNLRLETQRTQKPNYTVEQLSQKTHIPVIPPRKTILGHECEREMKINTGQEVIFHNNSTQLFFQTIAGALKCIIQYVRFFTVWVQTLSCALWSVWHCCHGYSTALSNGVATGKQVLV